jgi:D-cysteine desulfhydrase
MTPPRIGLATLPTPLVRAHGLEAALAIGPLFVKRDDLTGFGVAGNKARALEFLVGAAVAAGCEVLVAAGSPSSNFCAAAAVAARIAGLDCDLLFSGPAPQRPSANIALARAAGARLCFDVVATRDELDSAVVEHCAAIRADGRLPYGVPRGGANPVGAAGYAYAAREFVEQCDSMGIAAGTIVVATGSGGTQAGLVAGLAEFGPGWRVVGASVSRPGDQMVDQIASTSRACSRALGFREPSLAEVDVRDLRGAGFGIASHEDRISSQLALTHEGILLDDYYGAKAMTLFRTVAGSGASTPAVFWHTGGLVAALAALTQAAAKTEGAEQ